MNKKKEVKVFPENNVVPEIPEVAEVPDVASLDITKADTWKKDNLNIRKLLLPSGAVFLVKNVSLVNLAMKGIMLMPLVTKLIEENEAKTKTSKTNPGILNDAKQDELKGTEEIVNNVTLAAVLEPQITANGSNDSIHVDDIEFYDKMAIFENCVRGGAEAFAGFRK